MGCFDCYLLKMMGKQNYLNVSPKQISEVKGKGGAGAGGAVEGGAGAGNQNTRTDKPDPNSV